jgi:hypothetical protein
MPLSWNEIRNNAVAFAKEWEKEFSEDAEAKTFWDQFLGIFGVNRRCNDPPFSAQVRPLKHTP